MESTGPFTKDPSKLDPVALAVLKMRQVSEKPKEQLEDDKK